MVPTVDILQKIKRNLKKPKSLEDPATRNQLVALANTSLKAMRMRNIMAPVMVMFLSLVASQIYYYAANVTSKLVPVLTDHKRLVLVVVDTSRNVLKIDRELLASIKVQFVDLLPGLCTLIRITAVSRLRLDRCARIIRYEEAGHENVNWNMTKKTAKI